MNTFGRKIKILVVVFVVISLIASVIGFFIGMNAYNEDKDYIEYATAYGGAYGYPSLQRAGDNAYQGKQLWTMSLVLAVVAIVGSMPLYGFGVLVENSEIQSYTLEQLLKEQKITNEKMKKLEEKFDTP